MKTLFNNLMALCDDKDESKFYFRDAESAFAQYRIFSYNYASYSDWLLPDAMECRGIMFEMVNGEPVRIACRPMEKFFNLNETPFTMNLDFSKIDYMMTKADGSLVSSFMDGEYLRFKSKSSIHSEQAVAPASILMDINHKALYERVLELTREGFTLNFEYVAPTNRIVLPYQERALILLNARDNDTGEYVPYADLLGDAALRPYLVEAFEVPEGDFVKDIREMTGIEGYVFVMEDGLKFKLKTEWYSALHHTKDSINKDDRLFEVIVAAGIDDIRGMFHDDAYSLRKINAFEKAYLEYLSKALITVRTAYENYRGRDRKDYAMLSQAYTKEQGLPYLFSVIMQMYQGTMTDDAVIDKINSLFMKNYKDFVPSF